MNVLHLFVTVSFKKLKLTILQMEAFVKKILSGYGL